MLPPRIRAGLLAAACLGLGADAPPPQPGELHDDFEGPRTAWRREQSDTTVTLHAHERSERAAHDGRHAERFRFHAEAGSALYFSYPLPNVPIDADPTARLFVRSNQEGVQLFGRVVLPRDVDPDTGQPSFVLVPGARYDAPDRWQRLALSDLRTHVEQQARVLRAAGKRKVPLEGAYLERLVVNVLGGPGESDVFLDDLTVGPIPGGAVPPPPVAGGTTDARGEAGALPRPPAAVRYERGRLSRDGRPWFVSIASAPEADPATLYRAGFTVLDLPAGSDPELARRAARAGMLLMPELAMRTADDAPREPSEIAAEAAAYPELPSVAWWGLGRRLGGRLDEGTRKADLEHLRAVGLRLRRLPAGASRIATGEVVGWFPQHANKFKGGLDLIGVRASPWGSATELTEYQGYLRQRRDLTAAASPDATYWAMIDAAPPASVRGAAWGSRPPPAWGRPRVQPEQLRLFTYAALGAGYRGIGFRGDAELTRPDGRMLLDEMAFLNAEIGLVEPILAQGMDPITVLPTYFPDPPKVISSSGVGSTGKLRPPKPTANADAPYNPLAPPETPAHPSIRAASIATRDNKGQLLLVTDYWPGSQWQPAQLAFGNLGPLKLRVPGNESAWAYEISLGEVAYLERERVPGGIQITLPEFGPTAMILLTYDLELVRRVEANVKALRSKAILMAIEQAQLQYDIVEDIHRRLADDAHDPKDSNAADLLKMAKESLATADEALRREDYPLAWKEARRATRPLRLLMRLHFDEALKEMTEVTAATHGEPPKPKVPPTTPQPPPPKGPFPPTLVGPVSSPPLVSFTMLPRQYLWNDWIRGHRFGPNKLRGGSFDGHDVFRVLKAEGWGRADYPIDGVVADIKPYNATETAWGGDKGILWFKVRPARVGGIDAMAPFLDQPPVTLVSPPVRVYADEIVRISVNLQVPTAITPGAGGVIVRDSIGGEVLQFRTTQAIPSWRRVVLYRQAPADGSVSVMLGLAGFGDAFFDDLRIERLGEPGRDEPTSPGLAGRSRRRAEPGAPRPSASRPPARATR